MSVSGDGDGVGDWASGEASGRELTDEEVNMDIISPHHTVTPHAQRIDADQKKTNFQTIKRSVTKTMADFFLGDLKHSEQEQRPNLDTGKEKWRSRSFQLHSNKLIGGKVKSELLSVDTTDSVFDTASHSGSFKAVGGHRIIDPLHKPMARQDSRTSRTYHQPHRQWSHVSTVSSGRRSLRPIPKRTTRRESVIKMAYGGIRDWMTGSRKSKKHPVMRSRSFAPASVSEGGFDDMDTLKSPTTDSVFASEDSYLDDVFFDVPTPTSALVAPFAHMRGTPNTAMSTIMERSSDGSETTRMSQLEPATARPERELYQGQEEATTSLLSDDSDREITVPVDMDTTSDHDPSMDIDPQRHVVTGHGDLSDTVPIKSGWRIGVSKPLAIPRDKSAGPDTPDFLDEDMPDGPFEGMSRIGKKVIDTALDFDNSDRREIGRGMMGHLLDVTYRKDRMTSEIEAQIEAVDEHRPYFTYWVTFVQVVIYIISVSVYGVAPIGFEETFVYGEVLMPNLAIQVVSYVEKDNLWIGPRQADLIHLGAKYSPCMRKDQNVEDAIAWDHLQESMTACCIRNDGSGCVQMPQRDCSESLSQWYGHREYPKLAYNGSTGLVCGTDPRKCKEPLSQGAYQWNQDITRWPICKSSINISDTDANFPHMTCSVAGRPCCIGIQGECVITTREYCEFRKGFFHEEAFLCAQVSCMNEICGMIEFLNPVIPDQFYRLWTSLFLHAGLFQLLVSLVFQIFIMRDMEKLAGWLRIAIIYIGSGIAGSLSSAIFLPYHVEAGPAGSQFGVLAMLFVEVIQNFYIIKHPWRALGKLIAILVFLFILGLLPYIDNYAHLIGFAFGFLLSFALLPYITFNKLDRTGKIVGIVLCLIIACGLFAVLIVLFYVIPVYNCPYCHYFNCIPFTPKFCETMKVEIRRSNQ